MERITRTIKTVTYHVGAVKTVNGQIVSRALPDFVGAENMTDKQVLKTVKVQEGETPIIMGRVISQNVYSMPLEKFIAEADKKPLIEAVEKDK